MNNTKPIIALTLAVGMAAFSHGAFATNASSPSKSIAASHQIPTRSVIKVHTDHGVITMPGVANSWDEAERATFIADGIADAQMVNNQNPIRLTSPALVRH